MRWCAFDLCCACLAGNLPRMVAETSSSTDQHRIAHVLPEQTCGLRCEDRFVRSSIAGYRCGDARHPQWTCDDIALAVARLWKGFTKSLERIGRCDGDAEMRSGFEKCLRTETCRELAAV